MNLTANILTTLSARVVMLLLALISSIVLARYLGPEGRGLFALVLLLPELARNLGLLGFEQANAVYAGLLPQQRSTLIWHSALIACVLGGAFAALGAGYVALGAPGFDTLIQGPIYLYLIPLAVMPCKLLFEYWTAILRGMNRILLLNVLDVGVKAVLLLFAVLFVVWFGLGVQGAVLADFLISVAGVAVIALLLKTVGVLGTPNFDKPLWRRSVGFALPAYGGSLTAYLNYRVDEVIVAMLLPAEQLGFYVIAVGLAERLWILPGAVTSALLPHLTNRRERDPQISVAVARHVMIWIGLICIGVFVFAGLGIRLLYSSAYEGSIAPLRWLLPGIFTLSLGKVLVTELLAQEKPRYTVWASGIAAFVNIAANLVLVPRIGISGAALASSISYTVLSVILMWLFVRETGVSWTAFLIRQSDFAAYSVLWRQWRPSLKRLRLA